MATNKNQHYVPRCYLRPFTVDEANKEINLFNLDRSRLIRSAPVKFQCSKDNFYGNDPILERLIQALEGNYANHLRQIRVPGYRLSDEDREVLRRFWLFQHLRTEAAAKRAAEMNSVIYSLAEEEQLPYNEAIKQAVLMGMNAFATNIRLANDLKVCLLRNKTSVPFITSDNPAVMTNKWWNLNPRRTLGLGYGIGSAGVITLLPLAPELMCLGYDGDVYSVPHQNGIVDIKRAQDIHAYNQHQMLNCRANLFIKNHADASVIQSEYLKAAGNRPVSSHIINYAALDETYKVRGEQRFIVVSEEEARKRSHTMIHTQAAHPIPTSWPSQISMRSNGTVYTSGQGAVFIRYSQVDNRNWTYRKERA